MYFSFAEIWHNNVTLLKSSSAYSGESMREKKLYVADASNGIITERY